MLNETPKMLNYATPVMLNDALIIFLIWASFCII